MVHTLVVYCQMLAVIGVTLLPAPVHPFDALSSNHVIVRARDIPPAFLGLITAGSDGNMWFTETVERRIGRITPAGHVKAFSLPSGAGSPFAITQGPDGNVWFTTDRNIGRITVDGHITLFRLPGHIHPGASIIAGSDGNLWFITASGNAIVRITVTGRTRTFQVPEADSLAPGQDGQLWFTEARADAIGRMSLTGRVQEFPLPRHRYQDDASGVGAPISIVEGTDGYLWFTEFARRVGRIGLHGRFTEFGLSDLRCCIPFYITPGPDGNIWFTELYGNGVERISPRGSSAQFVLSKPWSGPMGIAPGADGNLWVTATCSNKVVRISRQGHITEYPVSARHGASARLGTGAYCFEWV